MNDLFYVSPATCGYGARVWVRNIPAPKDEESDEVWAEYTLRTKKRQQQCTVLNQLSCWGGADKIESTYKSWEFPAPGGWGEERLQQAVDFLKAEGFTQTDNFRDIETSVP